MAVTQEQVIAKLMARPGVRREVERIEKEEGAVLDLLLKARHEAGLSQAQVQYGAFFFFDPHDLPAHTGTGHQFGDHLFMRYGHVSPRAFACGRVQCLWAGFSATS